MDIKHLLSRATRHIDHLDAELLLAHVLKQSREFIIAHPEKKVTLFQKLYFILLAHKRKNGTPLAYLTGHKDFFGYEFAVNRHTLIPRPDTEILVEAALKILLKEIQVGNKDNKTILIDIGTGSGCIPISIVASLKSKNVKKTAKTDSGAPDKNYAANQTEHVLDVHASDTSAAALKVAKKNAERHVTHITFHHGNLLAPFVHLLKKEQETGLFITANLPYLDENWYTEEPSIQKEPKNALVAEEGGLSDYMELFSEIKDLQIKPTVFIEIDPRQTKLMISYILKLFPGAHIETHNDLARHVRVLVAKLDEHS